jgi:hypothetical protein
VAVLLGRSQAGLVTTIVAALTLGTLGGAALASGDLWVGSLTQCAGPGGEAEELDREGTFSGPSSVSVDLDCGSMALSTEPGSAWRAHAEYRGEAPIIDASATALALRTRDAAGVHRQDWTITAGADALTSLDIMVNAGTADATIPGVNLSRLIADMNAGDLLVDGSGASIADLDVSVNAGRMRITLGTGSTTGELSVNAGAIDLCVPQDTELRLDVEEQFTFATNLGGSGLTRSDETWTRPGTSGAVIDLDVEGNAASFTLDPEGGCK